MDMRDLVPTDRVAMAVWRIWTMDSWNPFSRAFWTPRNLWGCTALELKQVKEKVLTQLYKKTMIANPSKDIVKGLCCPLSGHALMIKQPLITIEGVVYEADSFYQRYSSDGIVAGSTRALSRNEFCLFPSVQQLIKAFITRQNYFKHVQQEKLNEARDAINGCTGDLTHASVFKCPLTKKLISQAVLTPAGQLYSYQAIKSHIEQQGQYDEELNSIVAPDPKTGEPLTLESLTHFEDFDRVMCQYNTPIADGIDTVKRAARDGVKMAKATLKSFANLGFWLAEAVKEEKAPREGASVAATSPPSLF